ncbi:hypothetical protein CHS0354_024689 [Potamilus streckersoni]|uniref:Uncharacterized protein n=1 Tax=Potamilus streckersoni TaxID=2493646 RepID=A0AAE0RWW5_9BIVA|nr:hypothetical protein CHS0354_024689 [Potamilus streckersoni]
MMGILVVSYIMSKRADTVMQTPELARSVETFVEITPVLHLPDPLLDPSPLSKVSLVDPLTVADVKGDFGGKERFV